MVTGMDRHDRDTGLLRKEDGAGAERVLGPARTIGSDRQINAGFQEGHQLSDGSRSSARARSPDRSHAEIGHDSGQDVAILAGAGEDGDTLPSRVLAWVMSQEPNRDGGDPVVPEDEDSRSFGGICEEAGAIRDPEADRREDETGESRRD